MNFLLFLPLLVATAVSADYVSRLPTNARDLFTASMDQLDAAFDAPYGYLYSSSSAYRHNTRSSAYYAVGLLARNHGSDAAHANKVITNIISGQFKDPAQQWFGTYQKYPEEPTVGPGYEPVMYDTWDPNWRGFVGCALIVALEEFGQLLPQETRMLVKESLRNATIGDTYRVGGIDGDNLYPAYSNPSIMRALVSGYTGALLGDANMTQSAETYAKDVIALFDRAGTLSEFNSATYVGVSLWALTLWAKYAPENSVMKKRGPSLLVGTWESVAEMYHPGLKNLAGPWDRGYGFDMRKYLSIVSLHFWTLVGKAQAPLGKNVAMLSHGADFSIGPVIAVLAEFHDSHLNKTLRKRLTDFGKDAERVVEKSAYSPPWDYTGAPRNISAWMNTNMSIGAESFIENVIGGPAENPVQFNPAVIQWWIDAGYKSELGVITLHATESSLTAKVSPGVLELSYPYGNSSSTFQFIVTQMSSVKDVTGWESLPNLDVKVDGNVDLNYTLSFNADGINDFLYWNFTYAMPNSTSNRVPKIRLAVKDMYN